MMAQEGDRRWLLNNWAQVASEIQDPRLSAVWCVAAGVGHLVLEEWDAALDFFSRALEADARFLKKIMTLCQRAPDMDMRQLQHRLRLIRLVIAAGKKKIPFPCCRP